MQDVRTGASGVLDARGAITDAVAAREAVAETMPGLLTDVGNLGGLLDAEALDAAMRQIAGLDIAGTEIIQDTQSLALGLGDADELARRLTANEQFMSQVVRGFSEGDESLGLTPIDATDSAELLGAIGASQARIRDAVGSAVSAAPQVAAADTAAGQARSAAQSLSDATRGLGGSTSGEAATGLPSWLPLALLGAALLAAVLLLVFHRMGGGAREAANELAEKNARNQQAILRLLDELGSLADGDLTVKATVTEEITGAIADSINYAIEALRELVMTIDGTATRVDETAQQTQASAKHLAQASENQSRQVYAATESIANMASSIEEVSGNAERSADVARHSVEIAHKGGEAVRRTIDGMNTIRETIQDTSKRIKRLGESSQEIGNIVELINDIAEQTNILALNASIQASMAGEQGRGFAVVADEVQRLAERSASATKQIEVLVKTIQSDTNEAVVSMERSTTDVVSGALLAENAGESLDEIEKVSNQIAKLVQNISATARQQATAAADMTRNMGVLQEISSQTADSTGATSESIGKLADMATELNSLVAGFRLPSDRDRDVAVDDDDPTAAEPMDEEPVAIKEAS